MDIHIYRVASLLKILTSNGDSGSLAGDLTKGRPGVTMTLRTDGQMDSCIYRVVDTLLRKLTSNSDSGSLAGDLTQGRPGVTMTLKLSKVFFNLNDKYFIR